MHTDTKRASERITYRIDFARTLERRWLPGVEYDADDYVRPTMPNGFEYRATTDGQTEHEEPNWPQEIGATVQSGSVTFICEALLGNASDSIANQSIVADPGISVAGSSVEGTVVNVTLLGGTASNQYTVLVQITTNAGEILEEKLQITVKA